MAIEKDIAQFLNKNQQFKTSLILIFYLCIDATNNDITSVDSNI